MGSMKTAVGMALSGMLVVKNRDTGVSSFASV